MRVNEILSFFFLFVTFVVLTVDQFVERGDGPFELQKQDSHFFRKTGTEKLEALIFLGFFLSIA